MMHTEDLIPDNTSFRQHYNRQDFLFDHGLSHNALFELDALAKLAGRIPKLRDFVYWQNGRVPLTAQWGDNPAARLGVEETIRGIATNDSLVLLKHVEQDPIYRDLLQSLLRRTYEMVSPEMKKDIVLGEALIFINSPGRKTPYHIDLESGLLLQVAGVKHVHVLDCTDRALTPHLEIENHVAGQHGVVFKSELPSAAHYYRLAPGKGVHLPSLGPHWVENADQVSISVNINFDHFSIHHRLRRIYRMNHKLRRLGITPTPPGAHPLRDAAKIALSRSLGALRSFRRALFSRRDPADAYPNWRPR